MWGLSSISWHPSSLPHTGTDLHHCPTTSASAAGLTPLTSRTWECDLLTSRYLNTDLGEGCAPTEAESGSQDAHTLWVQSLRKESPLKAHFMGGQCSTLLSWGRCSTLLSWGRCSTLLSWQPQEPVQPKQLPRGPLKRCLKALTDSPSKQGAPLSLVPTP